MPRFPKKKSVSALPDDLVLYRGARTGRPDLLDGPSYFSSSEVFARTYGPTAAFRVRLHRPLVVRDAASWYPYATNAFNPIEDVAAAVRAAGHDSVVFVLARPDGEFFYTVFLINPQQAELV